MIHTIRTVAVGDQESKIDSPIILYRGDREVEVEFTINGSKFTFTNGGNVIKSTNATHGQLVINTPTGENMFSEVTECHDGKVVFVITKEMIDELIEVGFYSFQIRLFDESQVSRVTIPPVLKGIDIRNPIAAEDETNVVDIGLVDYAVVVKDEFEDLSTFLPDGNYNKTEWESKDVISGAKLNKIEDALYNINYNMETSDLIVLNETIRNKNSINTISGNLSELSDDIASVESRINDDIASVESRINDDIASVESRINDNIASAESRINEKVNVGFFSVLNEIERNQIVEQYTVDDYYNMYDVLVSNNTSRFTWITLGKDQSDTYDIRLYRYVPTDYNRTLFVTCAIHGWEHYGTYIMYKLFERLLDDSKITPNMFELRKTRILCIPVANPWGLMADDHTGVNATRRGNSRGVDLNRNFDYRWDLNSGNFGLSKGDSPFSEKETQYIKEIFDTYKITHYLDLHSFNDDSTETRDYLFYGNDDVRYNTYQIINWLEKIYPGCNIEHTVTENDSSANNYAHVVRKIPSMNIELIKNRYGADDDRRWLELMENFLMLQAVSYHSNTYGVNNGFKLNQREYVNSSNFTVPETWTEFSQLTSSFTIDCDGIFIINGYITVEFLDGDSTTIFTYSPYTTQEGFYESRLTNARNKPYVKQASGVTTVPINSVMYVRKSFGDATFGVSVIHEGTGSSVIKRADCTYLFIPCDNTWYNMGQHNKLY